MRSENKARPATAKGMRNKARHATAKGMRLKTTFICVSPVSTVQVASAKAHFNDAITLVSTMRPVNTKRKKARNIYSIQIYSIEY